MNFNRGLPNLNHDHYLDHLLCILSQGQRHIIFGRLIIPKTYVFALKKTQKILHRTNRASGPLFAQKWTKVFHWKRSAKRPEVTCFGLKNAPFCCASTNLPNRTFVRVKGGGGGVGGPKGYAQEMCFSCLSFIGARSTQGRELSL